VPEPLDPEADLAPTFRDGTSAAPTRSEVWAFAIPDKAAASRRSKRRSDLPGAARIRPRRTFEQDDRDNWQGCTQTGRGSSPAAYALNTRWAPRKRAFRSGAGAVTSDTATANRTNSVSIAAGAADGC